MRALRHSDVIAAARALIAVPAMARRDLCMLLLERAHCADKYTKALGKPHPFWGNGTLMGAAATFDKMPEPVLSNDAYRAALMMVLTEVSAWRTKRRLYRGMREPNEKGGCAA